MTDQPAPFSFAAAKPKTADQPQTDQPKKTRKRTAAPANAEPEPKKRRKPRPVTVPIGILPSLAGMNEYEASRLMSIIGNLEDIPARGRKRIAAALGKIFK